jgi:hypothetical protein
MDQVISGGAGAAGGPTKQPPDSPPEPAAWLKEYKALVASVEQASMEWGISRQSREARFVSALLGATDWLGRLTLSAQANNDLMVRENRKAAEAELEKARQITAAATLAVVQARNAALALQCQQEHLVTRMIDDTLPLFVERLQGALVLRERTWNQGVQLRRAAALIAVVLGLVAGGYALRGWQDLYATRALGQCLAHPVEYAGRYYCDLLQFQGGGQ